LRRDSRRHLERKRGLFQSANRHDIRCRAAQRNAPGAIACTRGIRATTG
jgi:hypothetical protein